MLRNLTTPHHLRERNKPKPENVNKMQYRIEWQSRIERIDIYWEGLCVHSGLKQAADLKASRVTTMKKGEQTSIESSCTHQRWSGASSCDDTVTVQPARVSLKVDGEIHLFSRSSVRGCGEGVGEGIHFNQEN